LVYLAKLKPCQGLRTAVGCARAFVVWPGFTFPDGPGWTYSLIAAPDLVPLIPSAPSYPKFPK